MKETFGNIDVYLFDQLLKGRYKDCKKILDAGCGNGRNLVYFLKNGFEVYGIDQNETAIEKVKTLAQTLAPSISTDNFKNCSIEEMPFEANSFDLVLCNAVLHFAQNKAHFEKMLFAIWKVLKPGAYLFARLASNIGMEEKLISLGNGRYRLPDGSDRFLIDETSLFQYTEIMNGTLYELIKTTNVQNLRCMTTWCVQKK